MIVYLEKKASEDELKKASEEFGVYIKITIDILKRVCTLGGKLHADGEKFLIEKGSKQENIWGINLYPDKEGDDFIEYDSMINIKPNLGNRTRGVDDENIKIKIKEIIANLIK